MLDQIRRAEASGTEGRCVVDDVLRTVVELDGPGRDCPRVANSYAGAGYIQQFCDEIADIRLRNPGRAETCLNLTGLKVFWLDSFQSIDVSAIVRIDLRRIPRDEKLGSDVPAKVAVSRLPCTAFWVAIGKRSEFLLQFRPRPSRERLQTWPTDLAGLVERDQKRFGGGLDSLNRSIPLQRAPLEDRSFRGTLRLRVEFLKR